MGYVYAPVNFTIILAKFPGAFHIIKELEAFQNQVNVSMNSNRNKIVRIYRRALRVRLDSDMIEGVMSMRSDLLRSAQNQEHTTLRPLLKILMRLVPKIMVLHEDLLSIPEPLKSERHDKFDFMFYKTMLDLKRAHRKLGHLLHGSFALVRRGLRRHTRRSHRCSSDACALQWMRLVTKSLTRSECVEQLAKKFLARVVNKFQNRTTD